MKGRQTLLLTGVTAAAAAMVGSAQAATNTGPMRGFIEAAYVHDAPERTVVIVGGERQIRIFNGAAQVQAVPFDGCSAAQIAADKDLGTLFIACRNHPAIAVVSVADAGQGAPPDFLTLPGYAVDIAMVDGRLFATTAGSSDLFQIVRSATAPGPSTTPDMSAVAKVWPGSAAGEDVEARIAPLADGRLVYRSDPWHAGGVLSLDQWGQSLLPSEHFQAIRDLTVSPDGYATLSWTEPQGVSLIDFVAVRDMALDAEDPDGQQVAPIAELIDYTGAVAADGGVYALHKGGQIHFYDRSALEGEPPYAPTREVAHFEPFGHVRMRALPASGLLVLVGDRSIDFVPSGAEAKPGDEPPVCPPPPPLPADLQDADGDGVINRADRCGNTPAGEKVDAEGCTRAQFCAQRGPRSVVFPQSAMSRYSWFAQTCAALDYRNDQPMSAFPRDCQPQLTRAPSPRPTPGQKAEPAWFTAICR
jgi:hypothetical protein